MTYFHKYTLNPCKQGRIWMDRWDLAKFVDEYTNKVNDPSILRHSGILGAADEAVFNNLLEKKSLFLKAWSAMVF